MQLTQLELKRQELDTETLQVRGALGLSPPSLLWDCSPCSWQFPHGFMLSQKVLLHRTHQALCALGMWDITAAPKHPQAASERQRSPDRDGQFQEGFCNPVVGCPKNTCLLCIACPLPSCCVLVLTSSSVTHSGIPVLA